VVRVELDSEPAVLDDVKRRKLQLEVEAVALRAEEGLDATSTERLGAVKAELEALATQQSTLEAEYLTAKAVVAKLADTRREIEDTQVGAYSGAEQVAQCVVTASAAHSQLCCPLVADSGQSRRMSAAHGLRRLQTCGTNVTNWTDFTHCHHFAALDSTQYNISKM
jgi:hypothetical protein